MKFYTDMEAALGIWNGQRMIEIQGEIETDDKEMVALLQKAGLRCEGAEPLVQKDIEQEPAEESEAVTVELDEMTYQELRALAKERGIEGYYNMNTEELREALKEGA